MTIDNTSDVPHGADDDGSGDGSGDASGQAQRRPDRRTGPDVIADYLKTLPGTPGVYRMIDQEGNVIYVGKARSLKARVSNYARLGGHTNRIARMISATASMEFVTVRTEAEALLLEANLIKRFRPRFNVLLRDDKSFPFILIARDTSGGAPQIMKHRGARNRKGDYFGPFASAGAVNRTINMLQRAFLLRSCSDSVYESRTRPCLLHQIKRCSAPCTGEISAEDYGRLVDEATRFLRGESQNVRRMYQQLMEQAAEKLDFEHAATYRNRLWALAHVQADQTINSDGVEEADIFAAHQDGGQTCIQVFFFRAGQNWGNRAYYPKADRSIDVAEVLESFIAQFYDDKPVPRLILASHDFPTRELMAEALSIKAERKVEIRVPQRGAKSGLVEHASQNAKEALGRKLAETGSQRTLLAGVAARLGLDIVPRRVEVYDNSHISGTNAVGGMIVAGPEGFVKNAYRKFNIKSDNMTPGDDYGMMREVLTRRFKRLVADEAEGVSPCGSDPGPGDSAPEAVGTPSATGSDPQGLPPATQGLTPSLMTDPSVPRPIGERGANSIAFGAVRADGVRASRSQNWQNTDGFSSPAGGEEKTGEDLTIEEDEGPFPDKPDLVLIDGGAGQLKVACEVLADLGITDVRLVGVAKGPDRDAGREHFHIPGRDFFMLEPRDPVLYFIQRLRDEAHRFAIGAHREKRKKAIGVNPLEEIGGIGPKRKRALMNHFGSAKAVSRAGVEDLLAVEGISQEMAQKIYDFFNERKG